MGLGVAAVGGNLATGSSTPGAYMMGNGQAAFATGGVVSGQSISAYSNQIVTKPTYFANGGNVMGEAGPEAILPLAMTSSGNLGVRALMSGQGGPSGVKVTVNNYGTSKAFDVQQITPDEIRIIARDEAAAAVRRDTPSVVAAGLADPNSRISKSLSRSTTASRRR